MISIILTIHNQENILPMVLYGIGQNSSTLCHEIIIVLDGCTDNSASIVNRWCETKMSIPRIKVLMTPDVYETKANNAGLRRATGEFCLLIQDDMVMTEEDYDAKLAEPAILWPDVFAVTARTAHNNTWIHQPYQHIHHYDLSGAAQGLQRGIFSIRDSVNRGPLLLRHSYLRELGYLDEEFAPQGLDDHDICMTAYERYGWVSGAYVINYRSDMEWGGTRKSKQISDLVAQAYSKNSWIMKRKHYDSLMGIKHNEEREV